MQDRSIATVFGGSGFIGRYVVRRLADAGYMVRVAVRDPEAARFLLTAGHVAQIVPLAANITNPASIAHAVAGADLVVNLVGILAEGRAGDFQRIQGDGPRLIAEAATAADVRALVHVSAIGADAASPSAYGRSKAAGEAAVLAAFPRATILRPSIVIGAEDGFLNRFGAMAAISPIMPVLAGATRFQPVYVGDVATAVIRAASRPDAAGATYELGGPSSYSFRELLAYILHETRRKRCLLAVPPSIARLQATILERLPGKLLTRDQLAMLGRDNVVQPGMPGLAELGIVPASLEQIAPAILARFRPTP